VTPSTGELAILVIEDSEADARLMIHEIESRGYRHRYLRVENEAELREALEAPWDVIISDFRLPQFNAIEALKILNATEKDIPFIVVSQAIGEDLAVELMRNGAADYVMKSSLKRLGPAVEREVREARLRADAQRNVDALAESELRFRLLAEHSADMISRHAPDGTYLYVSPAFERILGWPPERFIGKPMEDFAHPDDRARLFESRQATSKGGIGTAIEFRALTSDDRYVWIESVSQTITNDKTGAIVEFQINSRDISKRKALEHRLRDQENFLSSVIASQINGVVVVKATGEIVVANDAAAEILGLQKNAVTGKYFQSSEPWMQIDHAYQPLPAENLPLALVLSSGKPVHNFSHGIRLPNGRTKWLAVSAAPIFDADGSISSAVASFVDETEAIVQRKALEAQYQRLRLQDEAISNAPSGIIIADAQQHDHPVVFVNDAFTRITGYSAAETLGKNCRFLQGPETQQEGLNALRLAIRKGIPGDFLLRNYRKDGSLFYIRLTLAPIRQRAGEVTHFVAVQTDVTEQVRATKEIETAQIRTRLALDGARLGLVDFSYADKSVFLDDRFGEILGFEPAELAALSRQLLDLVHPEDLPEAREQINAHERGQSDSINLELRLQHKTGSWVWVLARGTVVERTENQQPLRFTGTILDITERKEHESRILELSQQLIDISEAERAVISGELHDVVGQSLVLLKLNLLKFLQKFALRTPENEKLLLNPVSETLDQLRGISRRLTPSHMKKVGLGLAIEDMLSNAQELSGIKIESDIADLEDFFPDNWNIACFRIVQEAITNALKHSHASVIRVIARKVDRNLELEISDNGIGMVTGSETPGIGLALMRERVRGLRGHLFFGGDDTGFTVHVLIPPQLQQVGLHIGNPT
jgi:PAS domain S-box-containing protein